MIDTGIAPAEKIESLKEFDGDEMLGTIPGFILGVLGVEEYDWALDILWEIDRGLETEGTTKISVCCPNGAGKTAHICGPLSVAFHALNPYGVFVYTSAVGRQVNNQFMPAVKRYQNDPLCAGWEFKRGEIEAPNHSTTTAFTTNDAGKFEGWHKRPMVEIDGKMYLPKIIMVVDEAKSIQEEMFTAIDRCQVDVLLMISSSDHRKNAGRFYQSHHKLKHLYHTYRVSLKDCPHIDRLWVEKVEEEYGTDHPFVQSSVYGNFPKSLGELVIIASDTVNRARRPAGYNPTEKPEGWKPGDQVAWVDFAAGGDENTLTIADGNWVRVVEAWRETDTMLAASQFIAHFRKYGLSAKDITGDNSGLGKPVIDRLHQLGWQINRFNSNAASDKPEMYRDMRAQMWDKTRMELDLGNWILDIDDKTWEQLTTRRWDAKHGFGKMETKEKMREMGEESPDRAEGVVGVIAKGAKRFQQRKFMHKQVSFGQWNRENSRGRSNARRGFEAQI